jgi:Zn finger protein HypA/HybF involved in hydrogenase expression
MGLGFNKHKCSECELEFNSMWNSVTMEFWDGRCPSCRSTDVFTIKEPCPEIESITITNGKGFLFIKANDDT